MRSFRSLLLVVAMAATFDNIYPTLSYSPSCPDTPDGQVGALFCLTDNNDFTIWRQSSLNSTGRARIANVLDGQYDPTDLHVIYTMSPSYSGSSETDVIFQQRSDLPADARGIAWCNDAVTSTKCDQHYVAFASTHPALMVACHETGHAVGLTHGHDASPRVSNTDDRLGCMVTPVDYGKTALGSNNTSEINRTY